MKIHQLLTSFIILLGSLIPVNAQTNMAKKLTNKEIKLIENAAITTPFEVLLTTDPKQYKVLKTSSTTINPKDPLVQVLAERMLETVKKENGVGIAAPQIGLNRQAIWVQRFDKEGNPFEFFLNPKLTWLSDIHRLGREGCLSIPDTVGNVFRSLILELTYQTIGGEVKKEIIEGFTAVIFQHEYDHLIGVLFTERLEEQEAKTYQMADEVNEVYYLVH